MGDQVTLRDILMILMEQIKEVKDGQEAVVTSTNHKIDLLRKQGITALTGLLVIMAPVIAYNWAAVWQRAVSFF